MALLKVDKALELHHGPYSKKRGHGDLVMSWLNWNGPSIACYGPGVAPRAILQEPWPWRLGYILVKLEWP